MKTMKSIYTLAFALTVLLAATGCRHEPVNVTPIPGPTPPPIQTTTDIGTKPYNPNEGIQTTSLDEFEGMVKDPTALAADTIHFAYDSSAVRKSEQANLQAVAQALSSDSSLKLLVEGNCDERGTEEYNRALGERRALAAREALAKLGIDPTRIRTISYGKDKPVDPGHNEAAWSQNRRDDFVLLHPKTGM